MKIRPFKRSDADQIAQLFHDTIREVNRGDYTEEQVRAWAPDDLYFRDWKEVCSNRFTFVADDEGTVAGFAELEEDGRIDCFYCHKDYQRQGVGKQLYKELERKARALGLARLHVEASITAKPFFQGRGFAVVKEQVVETRGQLLANFRMEKAFRRPIVLEKVGYWNETGDNRYIEPQAVTGWWDPDIKKKVIRYLESGNEAFSFMGYSWCRFNCGIPDNKMGHRDFTDGYWIWPEGLSHYVKEHNVRLPEGFIGHMETNGWKVPETDPVDFDAQPASNHWSDFCRKQKGLKD